MAEGGNVEEALQHYTPSSSSTTLVSPTVKPMASTPPASTASSNEGCYSTVRSCDAVVSLSFGDSPSLLQTDCWLQYQPWNNSLLSDEHVTASTKPFSCRNWLHWKHVRLSGSEGSILNILLDRRVWLQNFATPEHSQWFWWPEQSRVIWVYLLSRDANGSLKWRRLEWSGRSIKTKCWSAANAPCFDSISQSRMGGTT